MWEKNNSVILRTTILGRTLEEETRCLFPFQNSERSIDPGSTNGESHRHPQKVQKGGISIERETYTQSISQLSERNQIELG